MLHPLLIFSQSDYLMQIVAINSHTKWQTVQIQISWLLQKPTDLDLHCLQRQGVSRFSWTRVNSKALAHLSITTLNIETDWFLTIHILNVCLNSFNYQWCWCIQKVLVEWQKLLTLIRQEEFDQCLHCLLRWICPTILSKYGMLTAELELSLYVGTVVQAVSSLFSFKGEWIHVGTLLPFCKGRHLLQSGSYFPDAWSFYRQEVNFLIFEIFQTWGYS